MLGKRFGKLIVIFFSKKDRSHSYWKCLCDCGATKIVTSNNLKRGRSTSCGCKRKETLSRISLTHGKSKSKIYLVWHAMHNRCYLKNHLHYHNYGNRGIKVHERWHIFENFYTDMGDCPQGLTLERIDNNGPYSKDNCRWATRKDQARNKRNNRLLLFKDTTRTLAEWSELSGVEYNCLTKRLNLGWSNEKALTTPMRK